MNARNYIELYEELFDVPHNMDDLMDRLCDGGEVEEKILIPFIREQIKDGYSQSALELYVKENPYCSLTVLDEDERRKFIKDLYRKERKTRK